MIFRNFCFLALLLCSSFVHAGVFSAGQYHTCVSDGRRSEPPICWGFADKPGGPHGELAIPQGVYDVNEVAAGAWHNCATYFGDKTQLQLRCWGDNKFKQLDPPASFHKIISLSVGRWHNCILNQNADLSRDVRCWGYASDRSATIPGLRNPTAIFAGNDFSCAIHDQGRKIKCWGEIELDINTNVFPNLNPSDFICRKSNATANQGLVCWSNTSSFIERHGYRYGCKISKGQVMCAESDKLAAIDVASVDLPANFHPTEITVGDRHACVLNRLGVHCWILAGRNLGQENVPKDQIRFGPSLRDWSDSAAFLDSLSDRVYKFDQEFLAGVRNILTQSGANQAPFVMNALYPFLIDLGYRRIKVDYIDNVIRIISQLNKEMAIEKLTDFSRDPAMLAIGWRILSLSLSTMKQLMILEAQPEVDTLLLICGKGVGAPQGVSAAEFKLINDYLVRNMLSPRLENRMHMNVRLVEYLSSR